MNELKIFENDQFGKVRVIKIDEEPWFVGKDVAAALGYSDTKSALKDHVDVEDKQIVQRGQIATLDIPNRGMTMINESGLYSLVMSSKLPSAKAFKRWVTSEVLPSIRRHGAYVTPSTLEEMISDPDAAIRLFTALRDEREQRIKLEVEAKANQPKVLFANSVSASDDCILIGTLAKMICQNGTQIGQNRLFALLRNDGYLMQSGIRRNLPTQRAMEMGLFKVKESTITSADGAVRLIQTPVVTGKGQEYFINRYSKKEQTKPWGGIFSTQN